MGYLLEYFLTEASWELERQNLDESCKVVVLTRSHKDIFEKVKVNISHKSLIEFLKTFNEWGFVLNERYSKLYTVQADPIREAMYNPKSCKVYPGTSTFSELEAALIEIEDLKAKSCNVEVKLKQLQQVQLYNIALETKLEAALQRIEDLEKKSCNVYPNVEALQHYNFSSGWIQAVSDALGIPLPSRDIERDITKENKEILFGVCDDSQNADDDTQTHVDITFPIGIGTKKETTHPDPPTSEHTQGEDHDTQHHLDDSLVHDLTATDCHANPHLQAGQDTSGDTYQSFQVDGSNTQSPDGATGRETDEIVPGSLLTTRNDLEDDDPEKTAPRISAISLNGHTPSLQEPRASSLPLAVASPVEVGSQGDTRPMAITQPDSVPSAGSLFPPHPPQQATNAPVASVPPDREQRGAGETQDTLIPLSPKPEMPPVTARWNKHTALLVSEAIRERRYTDKQREKNLKAAEKMFKLFPGITREQFTKIFTNAYIWWKEHGAGLATIGDIMAEGKNGSIRLQTSLERLELEQSKDESSNGKGNPSPSHNGTGPFAPPRENFTGRGQGKIVRETSLAAQAYV